MCIASDKNLICLGSQHGFTVVLGRHDEINDGHQAPKCLLLTQKQQNNGRQSIHTLSTSNDTHYFSCNINSKFLILQKFSPRMQWSLPVLL